MSGKVGYNAKFSLGDTPTVVSRARDVNLNGTASAVDTSSRAGAGWKNHAQGLKEWDIDGECLWVADDTALELLISTWISGAVIAVELLDGTGGQGFEGDAIITDIGRAEPLDGGLVMPFKMKGDGPLVPVDPA